MSKVISEIANNKKPKKKYMWFNNFLKKISSTNIKSYITAKKIYNLIYFKIIYQDCNNAYL